MWMKSKSNQEPLELDRDLRSMVKLHKLIHDINYLDHHDDFGSYQCFPKWKQNPLKKSAKPLSGFFDFKDPKKGDVVGVIFKDLIEKDIPFAYDKAIGYNILLEGCQLPDRPSLKKTVMVYEEHLYRIEKVVRNRCHVQPLEMEGGGVVQWHGDVKVPAESTLVPSSQVNWMVYEDYVVYTDTSANDKFDGIHILGATGSNFDRKDQNGKNLTVLRMERWWKKCNKVETEQSTPVTRRMLLLVDWEKVFLPFLKKYEHEFETQELLEFVYKCKDSSDELLRSRVSGRIDAGGMLPIPGVYFLDDSLLYTKNTLFKNYAHSKRSFKISELYRIYENTPDPKVSWVQCTTMSDWSGRIFERNETVRAALRPGGLVRVCFYMSPEREGPRASPEEKDKYWDQLGLVYVKLLKELPETGKGGSRRFLSKVYDIYMNQDLHYICVVNVNAVSEVVMWEGYNEEVKRQCSFVQDGKYGFRITGMGALQPSLEDEASGLPTTLDIGFEGYNTETRSLLDPHLSLPF
eukprot:Nk52_evm10s247 gene=Nk52_evmTU10s247